MSRRCSHSGRTEAALLLLTLTLGLLPFGLAPPVAALPLASASLAGPGTPPAAAVAEAPSVRSMSRSVPTRVQIPAVGVDTGLVELGLAADGSMQVPSGGFPAGWYRYGPTPGELGPAVVVGHVDWAGAPGVFFRLGDVAPGTLIRITRRDGTVADFSVTHTSRVAKSAFPTAAVYGDVSHPALRLITCGGDFDDAHRSYRDNVIVYADLVATAPTR